MQTIDVVIFSVVITFVSLSMAQNVLLNLSSDPAQVHAIHKIIGVLGLGAAGFSLFLFVLDENKGLLLILTVLTIVGIGAFLQKLKKDRQHVPPAAVKSTSTAPQKLDPSEMSIAEMLAAARTEVSAKSEATAAIVDESTSTAPQKFDPSEMSAADMLAAARDEVSGKSESTVAAVDESTLTASQKLDPSEMSIEDMLAVAGDEVSAKSKATASPVDDASSTDEAESFEAARPDTPQVDRDSMAIDEILAHCRKVDG